MRAYPRALTIFLLTLDNCDLGSLLTTAKRKGPASGGRTKAG
jgi:hypothetical protein